MSPREQPAASRSLPTAPSKESGRSQLGFGTYWLWFGILSLAFFWAAYFDRFFSADGVGYYVAILDNRWFTDFAWMRNHAVYLSQWPLVLAVRAGVTDLDQLEWIFAFGLYFPYLLSFALCCFALRGEEGNPSLLIMPLASMVVLHLSSDAVLTGEHHVFGVLTWPILFLALRKAPNWLDLSFLFLLLLAYLRLYESALATAPILILVFLGRILVEDRPRGRIWRGLAIALLMTAFVIAALSVLLPRDPGNRSAFLGAILMLVVCPQALLGILFMAVYLIGLLREPRQPVSSGFVVAYLILVALVAILVPGAHPVPSFSMRSLTFFLLPLLMLAAIALSLGRLRLTASGFRPFAVFLGASLVLYLALSRDWIRFRQEYRRTLVEQSGYIPCEDTVLSRSWQLWGWNNRLLSYAWSRGQVRAVVENPVGASWEPTLQEPVLSRYFAQPPAFLDHSGGASLRDAESGP